MNKEGRKHASKYSAKGRVAAGAAAIGCPPATDQARFKLAAAVVVT